MDTPTSTRTEPGQRDAPPVSAEQYNYEHFHPKYFLEDAKLAVRPRGAVPGDIAPEFDLQDSTGRSWRLRELRGKPVVLAPPVPSRTVASSV